MPWYIRNIRKKGLYMHRANRISKMTCAPSYWPACLSSFLNTLNKTQKVFYSKYFTLTSLWLFVCSFSHDSTQSLILLVPRSPTQPNPKVAWRRSCVCVWPHDRTLQLGCDVWCLQQGERAHTHTHKHNNDQSKWPANNIQLQCSAPEAPPDVTGRSSCRPEHYSC